MASLAWILKAILEVLLPFLWEKSNEPTKVIVVTTDDELRQRLSDRVREIKRRHHSSG
jgi:rRNA-processing protein FCF1